MRAGGTQSTSDLPGVTRLTAGHVWFAGVAFRFSGSDTFRFDSLPLEACEGSEWSLPTAATILARPPTDAARLSRHGVRWRWHGDRASLVSEGPTAALSREAEGQYRADGPDTADAQDFLTCLLWPALLREGGLVLHACAVEHQGRAVLFVGPSGAGKSTAASLLTGARLLARDVVSVFPAQGQLWVAALPGGTDPSRPMPASAARCLPVAAVLRVVQAEGQPTIRPRTGAAALGVVMGALRHGAVDAEGHERMLQSASEVSARAKVGEAHTVLGADLAPALDAFLEPDHG